MQLFAVLLPIVFVPLGALAAPTRGTAVIGDAILPASRVARQGAVVTPPPCVAMDPPPSEAETEERFNVFQNAFLVTKNLTDAFSYISSTYINHNPLAEDGPDAALDVLGPIWPTLQITPIRHTFEGNMGWLNYRASGLGEIVDRFRWEAGCIVEHWDQGERYPEGKKT